jgi:hypothetical protein
VDVSDQDVQNRRSMLKTMVGATFLVVPTIRGKVQAAGNPVDDVRKARSLLQKIPRKYICVDACFYAHGLGRKRQELH